VALNRCLRGGRDVDVQTFGDRLESAVNDAAAGGKPSCARAVSPGGWPLQELRRSSPTLENVVVIRQPRQAGELPLLPSPSPRPCAATASDLAIDARNLEAAVSELQAVAAADAGDSLREIFGSAWGPMVRARPPRSRCLRSAGPSSGQIVLAGGVGAASGAGSAAADSAT